MNEHEVFPNAPITEAVLDIRVVPNPSLDLSALKTMHAGLGDRFPDIESLAGLEGEFQFSKEEAQSRASVRPTGFLFRSTSEGKVVQARRDGFTFNKLPPYEDWERFSGEAKPFWQQYLRIAQPVNVSRIALRYINRLELPLPFDDFKKYILTVPEVAPGISQALAHFFMRLAIPFPDLDALAVVNLTVDQSNSDPSMVPLIFDIDVFKVEAIEPTSEEIWDGFETLRRLKNQIFLQSITEETRKLIR